MTRSERTLMTWMLAIGGGAALAACVAVVVALWVACSTASQILFPPANPAEETRAVVAKEVEYHQDTAKISAKLERHYEWNSTVPLDVTFTAYTPNGPADGCRVTTRTGPASTTFMISLTDEEAAAFGHPEARKTVSLRRADGQLVLAETEWRK